MSDTIAAIATARGESALAIVRLSGPDAVRIAAACFRPADLTAADSHTAHVGVAHRDAQVLDQVVATVFRAPRTATGEDIVEITTHGGDYAPQLVLSALVAAGARPADAGEFTQRAFLNGKLDLAQAEAVADLIHASSQMAHRASLGHVQGRYSDVLAQARQELLDLTGLIELELDFSEEDVAFADLDHLRALIGKTHALLTDLLGSAGLGDVLREGARVTIAGRPNAGKSTLLNALVGREQAIVSAIPGTTRDAVEADAEFGGLRLRFADTAGLRDSDDAIEAEGVRRALARLEHTDALVYVYDLSQELHADERAHIERAVQSRTPTFVIGNKRDLAPRADLASDLPAAADVRAFSAQEASAEQARALGEAIARSIVGGERPDVARVVLNQRHRFHLSQARDAVERVQSGLGSGLTGDLLALDLRAALDALGAITGQITTEDVLDGIFSRFCIGK
jgi:tRNA modification GTPase